MLRARAKPLERCLVLGDGIPLVTGEAVAGICCIEPAHPLVPGRLRENGSGRDRQAFGIAFDDRLLRRIQPLELAAINQQMLGPNRKAVDRATHRKAACPIDV